MKTLLKIIIAIIIFVTVYQIVDQPIHTQNEEQSCITVIITIDIQTTYDYCTNHTLLGDLIEEHKEALGATFQGSKQDPFGRLLTSLEGYTIKDNEFFFLYIDDEFGQYGIDKQIIEDNRTYEFKLDTY